MMLSKLPEQMRYFKQKRIKVRGDVMKTDEGVGCALWRS